MINTRSAAAFSIDKASCKVASKNSPPPQTRCTGQIDRHWHPCKARTRQTSCAHLNYNTTATPVTTLHHSTLKSLAKVGFCFIVIAVEWEFADCPRSCNTYSCYSSMSVCLSVCLHVSMPDAFLRVCRLAGRGATSMIQALKKKVTERKDITVTRLPIQLHTN